MKRNFPILAAAALLAGPMVAASPARAVTAISGAHEFAPRRVIVKFDGQPHWQAVGLPAQVGVQEATSALRRNARISYAVPDFKATASAKRPVITPADIPNDPGTLTDPQGPPGGWVTKQWNFLPWEEANGPPIPTSPGGINAIGAWKDLIEAGRPGARGITIAVLDTGIAYRAKGRAFRPSPDFGPGQFTQGFDFVGHDRFPLDENGHGTHVAGTIGEKTNNSIGLTGLAYGAKLMPVRVLNKQGAGHAGQIAKGIRYAVANGADVINMSFNFGCHKAVPEINEELRRAYRSGVVTVASIGNLGSEGCISPPATGPHVIGVGGTTEGGCLGAYALAGKGVDLLAPGGGEPVATCPSVWNRPIYQVTFTEGSTSRFGEPDEYVGTSMAAAHVSGVAALVLASGVLKPGLSPKARVKAVMQRLRHTSRSLGLPATQQGSGLIDAARATEPSL